MKYINKSIKSTCWTCNGKKKVDNKKCKSCNGTGKWTDDFWFLIVKDKNGQKYCYGVDGLK